MDNIIVVGMGEAHPIASNETEEGRAENRRVEISYQGMPTENVID